MMQTDLSDARKEDLVSYLIGINSENDQMEKDFLESEKENHSWISFLNKVEGELPGSKDKAPPKEAENPFLSSFLIELIHSIKHTLISIQNTSLLSVEKSNDTEFRKYAHRNITEDIKKIDSVLNSLLNYIHINTPIIKSNTLSLILEEVLEANEKQIQGKKIKIIKRCENDLPETFIHDEQVRFIFNSVLQYAILSTPLDGTIGLLIKAFEAQQGGVDKKTVLERNGYIEVAMGFTSERESSEQPEDLSGRSGAQREEPAQLILQLVKEILQKNHGHMTHEVDPKKPRTLIMLRFPMERRKVVYYEPISM